MAALCTYVLSRGVVRRISSCWIFDLETSFGKKNNQVSVLLCKGVFFSSICFLAAHLQLSNFFVFNFPQKIFTPN
jgi:hypothetical protein